MTKSKNTVFELKKLYEKGEIIVEAQNLYGSWKKIPKGQRGSFNEMVKQNFNQKLYFEWWSEVEKVFSENDLNFLRLKRKVFTHDTSENYGVGHASRLMSALDIIETLIDRDEQLNSFKLTKPAVQQWHKIEFDGKTVNQGVNKSHTFTDEACIEMLKKLWNDRHIVRAVDKAELPPSVHEWKEFGKRVDTTKATAQAINKAMREKHITLRVKYPQKANGLYLLATQN